MSRFTRGAWLRRDTARGEVAYVVETIAEHILSLHGWVALAVVFLLPALEASAFVGFLFPGEIAVILGGVLAFQGRISLPATLAVAIGGAVGGGTPVNTLILPDVSARTVAPSKGPTPVNST